MRVTFLQATNGLSLSKYHSTNEGFRPYPHVKKVTSSEYDLPVSDDGLQQLEQLIRSEGRKGFCMLKGNLKAPLFDES